MKHLAMIIFLITSLYSHETNCTDMFGLIFSKNLSDVETAKYIKYYIDDLGCDANMTIKIPDLSIRPNLLEYAYDTNKTKTFDTLLAKGTAANASLATSIGMSFAFFFRENGVGIDNKKASPELLEFIKTQKYKEFKEEKFRLIKKLLEYGQDPKDYGFLKNILMLINDEKDLEKILNRKNK
ncbi:hypothetical protein [Campylobacter concisus]|uniref:hypothetical protein n=1 Tax=Campylobacter concisus TaxID=199 RepID=UPI001CE3BEAE|nr:hypothetical protein [Campylobacter concisus]MCA6130020.1 hypothetical protein [Campylobacter concisus]